MPKKQAFVNPELAREALRRANGDRQSAYGQCVILSWKLTGRFAPGFNNSDLQAFYDKFLVVEEVLENEKRHNTLVREV